MNEKMLASIILGLKYVWRISPNTRQGERLFIRKGVTISLQMKEATPHIVVYDSESDFEDRLASLRFNVSSLGIDFDCGPSCIYWKDGHLMKLLEAVRRAGANLQNTRVEDLGLSIRAQNCLFNANLLTVGAFSNKDAQELLAHWNFSRVVIREINRAMLRQGIDLQWRC